MTPHQTASMIVVPESILKPCDPSVRPRRTVEYRIVHRVIVTLLAAGYTLWIDHDGCDERYDITSADQEPMAEMFACDEETLYVDSADGKKSFVRFVYGNDGWDVISDYGTSLQTTLAPVMEFAESCQ